ncbi:hypothetical protein HRW16_31770 [Streptomyces lunaelactis]|uniref:hypothetical protein n=1 Tax=Streptomyces lunaelactis TaxID=1535768 RepID=UPI001584A740|nr:hypothetical protein [Streptomyces lunaelactis]NUK26074.1 hypothetical protein [Streptomyces lunaelactis]NUK38594.1 hypothetical protein [Streptomyces lunaelactis]NUK46324.1 hypothetical protein [Streptomyces lunaelactis]NUK96327.1 hypothetical protein [Streptomyces lunaelactis]
MTRLLDRLVALLLRRFGGRRPPPPAYPYPCPYSCEYVAGPTVRRTGERPPRGEDSPLVRPYLVAHERQQQARRRALWLAVHGVDIGPGWIHGVQVGR